MERHGDYGRSRRFVREETQRTAYLYARFILQWHQEVGARIAASKMLGEAGTSYKAAVERFSEMDLHDVNVQQEMGRTQIGGIFEYFYSASCDQDLWSHLAAGLEIEQSCPRTMGEAGRRLLELVEALRSLPAEGRSGVPRDRELLLAAAEEFYKDLPSEKGIGGKSLLLSCSLERASSGEITLRRPDEMGFHYIVSGAQRDGLIDAVRNGRVTLLEVVGGPSERQSHEPREER